MQYVARGFLELLLFIDIDIRSVAVGETVGENCAVPPAEKDNRSVPARFSLACPRDPLRVHAAEVLHARRSNHLVLKTLGLADRRSTRLYL